MDSVDDIYAVYRSPEPFPDLPCWQVVFALDVVFGSFTRDGYFLRTYFWIDVVATFSMLLDMPHFVASVTGKNYEIVAIIPLFKIQ